MVRCQLVTGRTHQIRVHLAARGWPILGDQVYGQPDPRIARQALHAWRVMFPHPVTREPMEFEQPLPDDMRGLADPGKSHSRPSRRHFTWLTMTTPEPVPCVVVDVNRVSS